MPRLAPVVLLLNLAGCEWLMRDVRNEHADPLAEERASVVSRLSFQSGCPKEKVAIIAADVPRDSDDHAYRLTACGKPYACFADGWKTECKAALDSAAPQ